MESKCRQNYNQESEALVNHQINIRLNIRHYFQSQVKNVFNIFFYFKSKILNNLIILKQSAFYGRDDVGLKGFEKYFACLANQEHKQAEKLIQYQNDRGGRAVFGKIDSPNEQEWSTPLKAIELALSFKKKANLVSPFIYEFCD